MVPPYRPPRQPAALERRQTVTVTQTAAPAPTSSSVNNGQWIASDWASEPGTSSSPSTTVWWTPSSTSSGTLPTVTGAPSTASTTPGGTITNTTVTDGGGFTIVIELSVPGLAPTNSTSLPLNSTSSTSSLPSSSSTSITTGLPALISPMPASETSHTRDNGLSKGDIAAISVSAMAGGIVLLALLFYFGRKFLRERRENAYGSLSASAYPDTFAPRDFAGDGGKLPRTHGAYREVTEDGAGAAGPEMSEADAGDLGWSVRWANWVNTAQRPTSMDMFQAGSHRA